MGLRLVVLHLDNMYSLSKELRSWPIILHEYSIVIVWK